jgi:signal transduction histidine kinase
MKTQQKIALILGLTTLVIFLIFGGSIYYFLDNYSFTDFYKRLRTRATIAAQYNLDNDIDTAAFKIIREEHLERLTHETEYLHEVAQPSDLDIIAQESTLPLVFIKNVYQNGEANYQVSDIFYSGIRYNSHSKTYIVVVSAHNYYATHHLIFIRNLIAVALLTALTVIFYLSFYFSKHIFDPIKRITAKVQEISSENIHLRIQGKTNDNEITQLMATFNDLLDRLETAFEAQRNFISNASHEFGTPLTSIMGEAEVMLMRDRSPEDYKQALQKIVEQADRLNQITQTLLVLARTGYQDKSIKREIVRTDELLFQTKEMVDRLIPKNNVQIDMSLLPENPKKLKVMGDKQLLQLAFSNILLNACKYSNNKPVSVSIASSDYHVYIIVKDQGVGIPDADLPYIFEPFYRASNTLKFEGHGIGLSLSKNIVNMHHGQLQVSSEVNIGTTVQIRIPLAPNV